MTEIIRIDSYETKVENRIPVWYAVIGKGKDRRTIRMPSAYQDMYDDRHLAVQKITLDEISAEALDTEKGDSYIPLFTGASDTDA